MRESLKCWWWAWWWRWAWVCLAAARQEHCEVLNLSLQPAAYSLPTNLTVRPSASGWHFNFTLQEKEAPPAACVHLKETEFKVQVMLFKGDCVHGRLKKYHYLPLDSVPPYEWTTLALDVKDNTVLLTPPDRYPISLKAVDWSLPHDALQVTLTHDVEVAVGCHVNCPLYKNSSGLSDVKEKVWENHHKKLHFYFKPWTNFDKVQYEVVCKTRQDQEFRQNVDIQPGKDSANGAWHRVELELTETTAKVYLNKTQLQEIQLPDLCKSNMHVIWAVGEAYFEFECISKEVIAEETPEPDHKNKSDNSMHSGVVAVIALAIAVTVYFILQIVIISIICIYCRMRGKTLLTCCGWELKWLPSGNGNENAKNVNQSVRYKDIPANNGDDSGKDEDEAKAQPKATETRAFLPQV